MPYAWPSFSFQSRMPYRSQKISNARM